MIYYLDMSGIPVTANYLFEKSNRGFLTVIVNDHVKNINAKILESHNNGNNNIEYPLPVNFNVNNFSKSDTQLIIYSDIIDNLQKRGFVDLLIYPQHDATILKIAWLNGVTTDEKSRRKKIIDGCLESSQKNTY